jgi:hypothetical protein
MTGPNTMSEPDSTWSDADFRAAADVYMAAQDADDSPSDGAQDDGEGRAANRREATYRIRAREAEAAASAVEERVTRMQRAEVERQAARLHDPGDLWTAGVELVELLDEDGEVDQQRVAEAVAALADSKPYLFKPLRGGTGFGQGRRTPVDSGSGSGTSWGEVVRGR